MNVLITGGTGFIGSHVARYLHRTDPQRRLVLFDLKPDPTLLGDLVGKVTYRRRARTQTERERESA